MKPVDRYAKYSREELVQELKTLKKKKYGLYWDRKNSQESLDAFVNWENVPVNFTLRQFPVLQEISKYEIKSSEDKPINFLIEGVWKSPSSSKGLCISLS